MKTFTASKNILAASFITLALALVVCSLHAQSARGPANDVPTSWTAGPNLPTATVRAVGIFYPPNGRFYVMGGRASDTAGSDLTHPYEYTPSTNLWATKVATYPDNQVNN